MSLNIGYPLFCDFKADDEIDWQMSRAEKYCLIELLKKIQPNTSIEIGTYKGGSLQVLAAYSKNIYSIDISDAPKKFLNKKFPTVNFLVGESHTLIPGVLQDLESKGLKLEFVLIDGDHTTKAVKRDILSILNYPHKNKLHILLHDSFNPQCRKGIKMVDYTNFKHVKYVELDYIGGSFWHNETYREMWGGFALIIIDPENQHGAKVTASLNHMYKSLYFRSVHLIKDPFRFLAPIKQKLFKKLGLKSRTDIYFDFGK